MMYYCESGEISIVAYLLGRGRRAAGGGTG